MEELLLEYEKEDAFNLKTIEKKYANGEYRNQQQVSKSISKFAEALLRCTFLFEDNTAALGGDDSKEEDSDVNAEWLLNLCSEVPSELGNEQLSLAVWDASKLEGEGNQQDALFAALGASDEAVAVLFEIVPKLPAIQRNIRRSQLGGSTQAATSLSSFAPPEVLDEAELNRQKLRQEALDAAQVAAIAKAEAEAALGPSRFGSTHTISRTSDVKQQKLAQKAAKRAAQAMQRAKAAGAIIEESELLAVSNMGIGAGGLMGRTDADLQALQDSLQPEGSRYYHKEQGLPSGTIREDDAVIGYEKVTIPPPILDKSKLHPRLAIDDILDPDCAIAFSGTTTLNPMQSTVYDTAFNRRENMLVCAPTGAGKTNVAMLTVTAHFRDVGLIDGDGRGMDTGEKVVYIAPMKALAQEVVEKFSSKLKPLGLIVRELTGDMQLTKAEANSANVIVTTPEKWDVVTRKSGSDENALGNQCGLLIFDEIHLLADESRGAVIESVISRLHRLVESRQKQLRIVGLSATLPNYKDVAEFLHVPEKGLFYFGPEYRPVPLQQTFIGVMGNIKNRKLIEDKMNDVCYEQVQDALARGYQVMVFVHSRKGTSDTATALAQRASANGDLERYFTTQGTEGRSGDAYKRYVDRAKKARSREVTNHFYNGIGIHHAGLLRPDRKLTETMFADGAIKVLCCTATLAWGVNLPAHNVIIKGTDVYNPEKGKNIDLSILDVQQIFGRAGRPQFDNTGEAVLITNHQAVTRYLDKLVRSVPIESSFIKQLADHLNAEIVGGTVTNLNEAVSWLRYTYLSIRMVKNPLAYGINADKVADDPMLRSHCMELVRDAAIHLSANRMVNFDPQSGNLGMTTLGRVAAHFYIQAESVVIFNESMDVKPFPTDTDLLMLVASATEFENVRVRPEEQDELDNLQQKCPLELEGPVNDSVTKTFVLLQMYISRIRPKGFTLISDMNYIASNAARVSRAIFEMCLHTNQAGTAIKMCRIAKSVDNQFWWFQTPLRYFDREVGDSAIKALESRHHAGKTNMNYGTLDSTLQLLEMTPEEVGQICRSKKGFGQKIQRLIEFIPHPVISCRVLPVTQHVLRFQVEIVPEFEWHGRWHGGAVSFWFWVEGSENQRIYHQEHVVFTKRTFPEPIKLDIPIPAFQGPGNQYLLRLISETWVGVEITEPISVDEIRMPEQHTVYTDLFDLTPLPTTALQDEEYEKLFSRIETFNPVQTQLFHILYHTDNPIFLGAPTGSGKTVVAELALLRMKKLHKDGICIYIAPLKSLARERLKEWRGRFGESSMNWKVLELSGDTHHDQRALKNADVLVCTPEKWDLISRNWRVSIGGNKAFIKRVRLLIIDEIHLLGEERGAVLEAIVSRTRFISKFLQNENKSRGKSGDSDGQETVRIVGLSTAIANPQDLAHWIGIDVDSSSRTAKHGLYNFRPAIRPVPTKIHIQGYPGKHYCPRMASMNKPCYAAIKQHAPDRPSLIFVASRRQTRLTAFDLISYAASEGNPKMFLGCSDLLIESVVENIQDEALRHTISFGIGLHHAGLVSSDRDVVERMYLSGDIRVLVATATLAWGVNLPARLVIVKGTEYYDGKVSRYVDYPLTDVLQMIGRAGRPGFDTEGKAVVMVETSKKNFYKKFLYTPFPVESCLRERLCENLNAEIANGTVSSLMDATGYLTWTFFARRVKANPSYYGAQSGSEEDVEAFLLSVATETVSRLKDEGCVVSEGDEVEDDVRPTTLGTTSSQFYLKYTSPKQMGIGLRECARLLMGNLGKGEEDSAKEIANRSLQPYLPGRRVDELSISWLLYTLSFTPEFDELPVRHNEEDLNEGLSEKVMWGADTAGVQSPEREYIYRSPDVYADPHTKGFLLIQAFLEKTKLPISDYVNDTRTVMDNVPRLLAAMHFIASNDFKTDGYAEVVSQLFRTKQLISTKSTITMDPLLQLPGVSKKTAEKAVKELGDGALWHLRQSSRPQAEQQLKKFGPPKAKGNTSALNTLFSFPKVTVAESKIVHNVDKITVKSKGTLTLKMDIDKKKGSLGEPVTLGIVVASNISRRLLGYQEATIGRNGSWSVEKSIDFDWEAARSDGGEGSGTVIVRLLLDSIKGLDSELLVKLV